MSKPISAIRRNFRAWYGAEIDNMSDWQLELLDAATWRVAQKLARREFERKKLAQQGGCN